MNVDSKKVLDTAFYSYHRYTTYDFYTRYDYLSAYLHKIINPNYEIKQAFVSSLLTLAVCFPISIWINH